MEPFTTIYAFMFEVFGLRGVQKEVFAVILGFWLAARHTITVPYQTIHRITGGSKSVIAKAIKDLEKEELIQAKHSPGKRTQYDITAKVVEVYEARMYQSDDTTTPQTRPVSGSNRNRSSPETSSGSECRPTINRKFIRNKTNDSLSVPDKDSYSGSPLRGIT